MSHRTRRRSTVIATTVLVASLLTAPPANAAAGSFYAGNMYEHHNSGGLSDGVFFTNVGTCDSAGYTITLTSGTGFWDDRLSSFGFSGNNGCNRARIKGKNGVLYYYSNAGQIYNLPAGLNDAVRYINFYRR